MIMNSPDKAVVTLPIVDSNTLEVQPEFAQFSDGPHIHVFKSTEGFHVYVANLSQVFSIPESLAIELSADVADCDSRELLNRYGILGRTIPSDQSPTSAPIRSLSLAIAQKCNLGCGYCYAQEGSFGGPASSMSPDVARASVERLLGTAIPGEKYHLVFLGGEPLLARDVLRMATEYAAKLAIEKQAELGFSLTSNGTLITPDDAEFFEQHGFSVTISLDGVGAIHDQQRPFKSGRGSFAQILQNVQPLLRRRGRMQVSARVTVTPLNLQLLETLTALLDIGFHSVGFSPLLAAPTGANQMNPDHLKQMLENMIECGREFESQLTQGKRFPFSNMTAAMKEIHQGSCRPYPCGAGIGYFGVSAKGEMAACHRFVGDEQGRMGNIADGIDANRQFSWLSERHVDHQEPCRSCWARYLCGGGCHHEVIHRGRVSCDYIRGWLTYCLEAYTRLLVSAPGYFRSTN